MKKTKPGERTEKAKAGRPAALRMERRKAEIAAAGPDRVLAGKAVRGRATCNSVSPPWIAPDDMPQWLVDLVRAGKACGADLRARRLKDWRSCGYCTLPPAPFQRDLGRPLPHRCRYHGGNVVGSAITQKVRDLQRERQTMHGYFSQALLPGEEEVYAQMLKEGHTSLDREIAMCKLRLVRAVEREARQLQAIEAGVHDDAMDLQSVEKSSEVGPLGVTSRTSERREMIDWGRRASRITRELADLLHQKNAMDGAGGAPEDAARMARQALQEARRKMGVED